MPALWNANRLPALVLVCCGLASPALFGQPSVLTWHNDNARTGQNLNETILTPLNVQVSTFGKLFVIGDADGPQGKLDGKVDAQPLYVPSLTIPGYGLRNVLYVMTEHGTAYAFDAEDGTRLWKVSLLGINEGPSDARNCGQVTPEIGITATPAIDLNQGPHGTIYIVVMSKDASGNYHQRLHALDVTTGGELLGGPTEIQATYPGTGVENVFLARQHEDRAGLLILNNVVYTSWSSHCDSPSYTSWVIGYSESTLQRVSVLNLTPNGSGGGIWAAGAGPAGDSNGNFYLLTGNGSFDTTLTTSGFPVEDNYGNAFVKISTLGGSMAVADYFTMSNTVAESGGDVDLGSGGTMLLPSLSDPAGQPVSLAVGAGKDGNVYVVNVSPGNMGKFSPTRNAIYQQLTGVVPGGVWSSPAWFNGKMYYGDEGQALKAFAFANGAFTTIPDAHSGNTFGYPGTTPSISANGTSNGIVWAVEAGENLPAAVLHAYDAEDLSHELYNSNQSADDHFGAGNKFIVPTIANGKVYVGSTNGVGVFGLRSTGGSGPKATMSAPAPGSMLSGSTVAFSWAAGSGASAYWLDVGTLQGQGNIFGQNVGLVTIHSVSGIPTNGGAIYVRLWTLISGTWSYNDYTYTAATGPTKAVMSTPAPGSTLSGSTVTFNWTAGIGASAYWLDVGIIQGQGTIFASNMGSVTGQSVSGIPSNGGAIYVRLWTQISGSWSYNDYTYTAATGPTKAVMSTPAPGSTLSGQTVAFSWTAGIGASAYWLDVGTIQGQGNIFGNNTGVATSQSVSGIPTDARTIYVRLWTQINSGWSVNDYSYTAAGNSIKAVMTTPSPGSTLSGSSVTFSWTSGTGASAYWLDVGTIQGQGNIFGNNLGVATSQSVSGIPINGAPIFVRLWTLLSGNWSSNDYSYFASTTGIRAAISAPAPNSPLNPSSVMFTGAEAQEYGRGYNPGPGNVLGANAALVTIPRMRRFRPTVFVRLWRPAQRALEL